MASLNDVETFGAAEADTDMLLLECSRIMKRILPLKAIVNS